MNLQDFSKENVQLMSMLSEAELKGWNFSNHVLEIQLLSEDGEEVILVTETSIVISEKLSSEEILNTCHIEIVDAREKLKINNGYYIPDNDFTKVMKFKDMSFFYGKSNDLIYYISFVGYKRLLSFPVKKLSDIKFYIR